ncbi:MAG: MotE family protein [Alphaproteobacteria bacterium]
MISYSRILPLLIIVAILSFSVRLTEVITGLSDISASAYARADQQEKTESERSQQNGDNGTTAQEFAQADIKPSQETHTQNENQETSKVTQVNGSESMAPQWKDASDSNLDITGIKLEMFEDLSERRARLEEAERAMQVREALLKAAEKELDSKINELESLRSEIEELLEERSGQEEERIDSLVKIYEGMKPKDAARIFDTLDLDVLVRVMFKMSERRVSPILAAMNAERARTVTIMLAEQRSLPLIE